MTHTVRSHTLLQRMAGAWNGWFNPEDQRRWRLADCVVSEAAQSLRDIDHLLYNAANQEKLAEALHTAC